MKWTSLRSLSQAQAIYWMIGLWVPVITGIIVIRASALVGQYPSLSLINYPDAILAALLLACAGTIWAIFSTITHALPPRQIREHRSKEEYLEKVQKSVGDNSEWPAIYTTLVETWEKDDRIGVPTVIVVSASLLMAIAFILGAMFFLSIALLPSLQQFAAA